MSNQNSPETINSTVQDPNQALRTRAEYQKHFRKRVLRGFIPVAEYDQEERRNTRDPAQRDRFPFYWRSDVLEGRAGAQFLPYQRERQMSPRREASPKQEASSEREVSPEQKEPPSPTAGGSESEHSAGLGWSAATLVESPQVSGESEGLSPTSTLDVGADQRERVRRRRWSMTAEAGSLASDQDLSDSEPINFEPDESQPDDSMTPSASSETPLLSSNSYPEPVPPPSPVFTPTILARSGLPLRSRPSRYISTDLVVRSAPSESPLLPSTSNSESLRTLTLPLRPSRSSISGPSTFSGPSPSAWISPRASPPQSSPQGQPERSNRRKGHQEHSSGTQNANLAHSSIQSSAGNLASTAYATFSRASIRGEDIVHTVSRQVTTASRAVSSAAATRATAPLPPLSPLPPALSLLMPGTPSSPLSHTD